MDSTIMIWTPAENLRPIAFVLVSHREGCVTAAAGWGELGWAGLGRAGHSHLLPFTQLFQPPPKGWKIFRCPTLEGINRKSNFCKFNRAVKQTFREAIKNTKLAKMPKYQVLTKPIGSIGVDKSQCTNETVIFGKLEVSNEDFTICPYNPLFFPNVQCLGGMFSQSPVVLWSPVTQFLPDQLDYTRTSHLAAGKHK